MSLKNNGEGVRQHRAAPSSGTAGLPAYAFHGLHGVGTSRKAQSPKSASSHLMATKAFSYVWGGSAKGDAAAAGLREHQPSAPTAMPSYRACNCGTEAVMGGCGVSAAISSSPARRCSSISLQVVSCAKPKGEGHLPALASGLARKEGEHGDGQRVESCNIMLEAGTPVVPNTHPAGRKHRDEAQGFQGFPDQLMAAIQLLAASTNGATNMEIVAQQEVAGGDANDDGDIFAEYFPLSLKEVQCAVEILQDHMQDQSVSASAAVCSMCEEAPKSAPCKNSDEQEGWWGLSFSDDEDGGDENGGVVEDITMELMQLGLEKDDDGAGEDEVILEEEDRPALLQNVPHFTGTMAEELASLLSAMRLQQHYTQSAVDSNGASFQSETVTYNNSEMDWWDAMSSVYKAVFNRINANRAVLKGLKV